MPSYYQLTLLKQSFCNRYFEVLERTQKAPSLFKKGLSGLGKTYDGNLVKQKVSLSDNVPILPTRKDSCKSGFNQSDWSQSHWVSSPFRYKSSNFTEKHYLPIEVIIVKLISTYPFHRFHYTATPIVHY